MIVEEKGFYLLDVRRRMQLTVLKAQLTRRKMQLTEILLTFSAILLYNHA